MHAVWFAILASMLTAYAVLDGFDFGAGILHKIVAKTDDERRLILAAIGPFWDGNEVWLIASGGVFVFAFPRAYAAAFSGLYLALMIVLWLLVLRGVAIEFRSKVSHPLWHEAWDTVFAGSSFAMALVLGVALGNVVRGVPLDGTGYFHEDLFAEPGAAGAGAIDLYTSTLGLFAAAVLAAHGATFLAWKVGGDVGVRSRALGRKLWIAAAALGIVTTAATAGTQPSFFRAALDRPWVWPLPLAAAAAAAAAIYLLGARRRRDRFAFIASSAFIASMLLATGATLFPVLLRSTVDGAFSIDVTNGASGSGALASGLVLLSPALALAGAYAAFLFRTFRGKVERVDDGEGH